jgi:hypothetical protein
MAKLHEVIDEGWEAIHSVLRGIWTAVDEGQVVRRAAFFTMLYMTVHSYLWIVNFISMHSDKPSLELAAIAAAVLTPINALQGFIFKVYSSTRTEEKKIISETETKGSE